MLNRMVACFCLATFLACSPGGESAERQQAAAGDLAASFQGRIDARNRDLYAAQVPQHGVDTYRTQFRTRVAADTVVMNYYAGLLEGKNPAGVPWDTSVVIWWLAESDDPRYLPVFLRFTRSRAELGGSHGMAIYGLARHSEHPDARARLQHLARTHPDRETRSLVARMLMDVDGAAARDLLRTTEFRDIHPGIKERLLRHLSQPSQAERGWPPPESS